MLYSAIVVLKRSWTQNLVNTARQHIVGIMSRGRAQGYLVRLTAAEAVADRPNRAFLLEQICSAAADLRKLHSSMKRLRTRNRALQ